MGTYKDHIPTKAFLVSPDYETKTATVDGTNYSRNYFKKYSFQTYDYIYDFSKYPDITKTDIADTTAEFDAETAYTKGERTKVEDFGVIFECGADVPAGSHPLDPLSSDENGVPYWVEADTIDELKPFDVSAVTTYTAINKGIKISASILSYALPIISTPQQKIEHISILGIKGDGKTTKAYVRFYHADIMGLVSMFSLDENKCNYYNTAIIEEFEIDLTYRDRISFSIPTSWPVRPDLPEIVPDDSGVMLPDGINIAMDIFIESRDVKFYPGWGTTPCGGIGVTENIASCSIGLVTSGKRNELGLTEFGMLLGRVIKRNTEANYLRRRTIISATETFECSIAVEGIDEHLKADHFFRQAAETSHIIHSGSPDFDWRFVFGVVDGNSPVDNPTVNELSVDGYGAAFFATDPLITQQAPEGWG